MRKLLLGLCAATAASAAMAAPADFSPVTSARINPAALSDFESVMIPESKRQSLRAAAREGAEGENTPVEPFDFTLAEEPYTAMSFGQQALGVTVWQGFQMTEELSNRFAGAKVTSFNLFSPVNDQTNTNTLNNCTVALFNDTESAPVWTQKGTIGEVPFELNKITLDNPFEIEAGKSFVLAYAIEPQSTQDYYLVVDGWPRATSEGCLVGVEVQGQREWMPYADQLGNLCIGMTIESDNLPMNGIDIYMSTIPSFVATGSKFDAEVYFSNTGINDVKTMDFCYTIGNAAPVTIPLEISESFPFNAVMGGLIGDLVCNEEAYTVPVKMEVTKVNGEENTGLNKAVELSLTALSDEHGFKRVIVAEEGTGTWCQWCPAGIVFMEYLKKEYPEVIRVALHGGDDMEVESGVPVLNAYFPGFPGMVLNRFTSMAPTQNGILEMLDQYMATTATFPTLAEVSDLSAEFVSKDKINVTVKTRFGLDVPNDDARYGISFSVTEDGVGPYIQTNAYAGGEAGPMGGWENKKSKVATIYDDVLREDVGGVSGLTEMFPAEIKAGTEYEFTCPIDIFNVTDANFRLNAMIIDSLTGEIVNARQITLLNSGVEAVETGKNVSVSGAEGALVIEGEYAAAVVYDFSGRKVAEAAGESVIKLAAGLYIAEVDGTAVKVMVK